MARSCSEAPTQALWCRRGATLKPMCFHTVVSEAFEGERGGLELYCQESHLEAFICPFFFFFCDPAIKMMCTNCPHASVVLILGQESPAPCSVSLPAEEAGQMELGAGMCFCLFYAQPPSVNTHLTNRVQLPLSQSRNHNGPGVSQLFEPGAVQQVGPAELAKSPCGPRCKVYSQGRSRFVDGRNRVSFPECSSSDRVSNEHRNRHR